MKLNKKIIQIGAVTALLVLVFLTAPQFNNVQAFLGGNVSGEVTCGGTAVQGATVSLIVDENVEDTDTTDANGEYYVRYTTLLQQTIECTIKVEKSGYTTLYRDTYLYPSNGTDLDIEWEITQTCNGYVYDHRGIALSDATVKLKEGSTVLESDTTDANGYYSFSEDVQENLYCKIQAEKTGYETHYIYIYCSDQTTSNTFRIAADSAQKYALFFYASDAVEEQYMETYGEQLIDDEGFDSVAYYEDEDDWDGIIRGVLDTNETSNDFDFIYVVGHGNYDSEDDDSYVITDPSTNAKMYSDDLASELSVLESKNIFVLIESCKSGGFVDDVQGSDIFVISTTDKTNYAYLFAAAPDDPIFTHYFFERIDQGYNDGDSYSYARQEAIDENNDQNPQYNDQIDYEWFKWW